MTGKQLDSNSRLQPREASFHCVSRCSVPRLESFRKTPLQHIEIFDLANHLGNYDLIGEGRAFAHVCFVVRYSLPCAPRTLNIAGAGDVEKVEAVGGSYVMWIESSGPLEPMFCVTPTTKAEIACADLVRNPYIARIKFSGPLVFSKRTPPLTAAAVNGRPERPAVRVIRLEFDGPVKFFQGGIKVPTTPVME